MRSKRGRRPIWRWLAGGLAAVALVFPTSLQADYSVNAGDVSFKFYGFVQADFIYDFQRVDPDWKDMLRPSKIPVNCPGDPGCGRDGETIFSVRQTRAGVDAEVPTELGDLKTKLEFELVGVGGDAGKTTPRLRHAYGELGSILAGQTWSTFMDPDVFPNSIEYWGPPGMVFFRNIQLRWTPIRQGGNRVAIALEAPSAAIDSGKVNFIDPTLGLQDRTQYPDLTAHWRTERDWGHVQVAGIVRSVGFESNKTASANPSGQEIGAGVNVSTVIKVGRRDKIKAEFTYGRGIASYLNDGGIDLGPSSSLRATTLPIIGWLAFYDHWWSDRWSTSFGWSEERVDNTGGQTGDAFTGSGYGLVNLLFYPTKNILVGTELQYGSIELKDGSRGSDTRIQTSFKWSF